MLNIIEQHNDLMLQRYTNGEYFEVLKKAKNEYMSLTGKLDEDQPQFESRMNCFNDWYLFQYVDELGDKFVEKYIKDEKLDPDLSLALLRVNHSLFQYKKINSKRQIILEDLLHQIEIKLSQGQEVISLAEDDLFMGRTITYQGETILLRGIVLLPNSIKSIFVKECKKILKKNNFKEERDFLLKTESLVTRSMNYLHIQPEKIFIFN